MADRIAELEAQIETATAQVHAAAGQPWSPELVKFLGVAVLAFSLALAIVAAILLYKRAASSELVLKVLGLILVTSLSAFLMIVGYGNEQLTPVIGLFGAIAGYLLGQNGGRRAEPRE